MRLPLKSNSFGRMFAWYYLFLRILKTRGLERSLIFVMKCSYGYQFKSNRVKEWFVDSSAMSRVLMLTAFIRSAVLQNTLAYTQNLFHVIPNNLLSTHLKQKCHYYGHVSQHIFFLKENSIFNVHWEEALPKDCVHVPFFPLFFMSEFLQFDLLLEFTKLAVYTLLK